MTTLDFETVRELGLALPDVTEGTAYGAPALKLGGKLLACIPVNKSAEAQCVAVRIGLAHRAELLQLHPAIYYITDHYEPYPVVLVRLSKISRAQLGGLLREAHAFVSSSLTSKKTTTKKRAASGAGATAVTKRSSRRG